MAPLFFGVEPNCLISLPLTGCSGFPAVRHLPFGGFINGFSFLKNLMILPLMPLLGGNKRNTTMAVLCVVPGHKLMHPSSGLVNTFKWLGWTVPLVKPRFPISDHFQWKPLVQKIDFNDLLWFFWHTSRVSFSSVDKYGIRTAF